MNEHVVGDADGFLASPTQEQPLREEVEEQNLMTNLDNQRAVMKEWITPLALGRGSQSSFARKDTG